MMIKIDDAMQGRALMAALRVMSVADQNMPS
jgi:hypothetical protein